jgi:hypothetical protein
MKYMNATSSRKESSREDNAGSAKSARAVTAVFLKEINYVQHAHEARKGGRPAQNKETRVI